MTKVFFFFFPLVLFLFIYTYSLSNSTPKLAKDFFFNYTESMDVLRIDFLTVLSPPILDNNLVFHPFLSVDRNTIIFYILAL